MGRVTPRKALAGRIPCPPLMRKRRRPALALAHYGVPALSVVEQHRMQKGIDCGCYTPLFPFLFDHVPGIDLFRRPVGATFIFVLGLGFLSGHLATDYVRDGVPR